MADREKVFDALRNCVTEPKCKDCPWEDCEKIGCKRTTVPVTLLLDTLNLLKEQPQWISVKDRLPETRHAVLVYTPHHKNIWASSMHEDGNWYIWSPGGKVLLDPDWHGPITHWMPLPESPEVMQNG